MRTRLNRADVGVATSTLSGCSLSRSGGVNSRSLSFIDVLLSIRIHIYENIHIYIGTDKWKVGVVLRGRVSSIRGGNRNDGGGL